MSDMSYTLEQFEQDKQTLLNLIADCEELEMKENCDEQYFIQCDEFTQDKYTVWYEFSHLYCQRPTTSWRPSKNLARARFPIH